MGPTPTLSDKPIAAQGLGPAAYGHALLLFMVAQYPVTVFGLLSVDEMELALHASQAIVGGPDLSESTRARLSDLRHGLLRRIERATQERLASERAQTDRRVAQRSPDMDDGYAVRVRRPVPILPSPSLAVANPL